jgi:hypothetical protein
VPAFTNVPRCMSGQGYKHMHISQTSHQIECDHTPGHPSTSRALVPLVYLEIWKMLQSENVLRSSWHVKHGPPVLAKLSIRSRAATESRDRRTENLPAQPDHQHNTPRYGRLHGNRCDMRLTKYRCLHEPPPRASPSSRVAAPSPPLVLSSDLLTTTPRDLATIFPSTH